MMSSEQPQSNLLVNIESKHQEERKSNATSSAATTPKAASASAATSSTATATPSGSVEVPEQAGEVASTYATLKSQFQSHQTRDVNWRLQQLRHLLRLMTDHEAAICEALQQDLHKGSFESWLGEILMVRNECEHAISKLKKWTKPVKVNTNMLNEPGSSYMYPDPLGTVLIIAPFNYPVQLSLCPLVGAISAGNTALLKPSEMASHVSLLLAKLIPQYLDRSSYAVLQGAIPVTTALLAMQWDLIFFTGSTNVGKIVMSAAAKHLTPVILELGGKSPTFVDSTADIEVTAKRILWGKFMNASQTCIAPDYVLVTKDAKAPLIAALKMHLALFYGADPKSSPDFCRIITTNHVRRLASLLDNDAPGVEPFTVEVGGKDTVDVEGKYFPPTILSNVNWAHRVMSDEIFGPILPIITINDIDEGIAMVNSHPKPLACYVFSKNTSNVNKVLNYTTAGGVTVNDCLMHVTNPSLPFGGVGPSGVGSYHGIQSFKAFSHMKPVMKKKFFGDVPQRYPPYNDKSKGFFARLNSMEKCFNFLCCCCGPE